MRQGVEAGARPAKVGVEGSSPFARSNLSQKDQLLSCPFRGSALVRFGFGVSYGYLAGSGRCKGLRTPTATRSGPHQRGDGKVPPATARRLPATAFKLWVVGKVGARQRCVGHRVVNTRLGESETFTKLPKDVVG
jgi:hypothetical protein